MDFNQYQEWTRKLVKYKGESQLERLTYTTLGLNGEAGEAAEVVKKVIRDNGGILSDERKAKLVGELSDVLFYLSRLADEVDVPFAEVARFSVEKLESRNERGKIHGDGSFR